MELRHRARNAFSTCDPDLKVAEVLALGLASLELSLDCDAILMPPPHPGRPEKPILVHPQEVPRRSPYTTEGHAALVHAVAHIEFNAINLALDAVWRFNGMPTAYYHDWMRVAQEEAKHFSLLHTHLQTCGYQYGHFLAHDGLWTMCAATQHDVVARMALVPRTLEARGLDATPIIQTKLRKVATAAALAVVDILDIILEEEVGHVAIGNHWYHWLCQRQGLDPVQFYQEAALQYGAPRPKPPFNREARRLAGFSEVEIQALSKTVNPLQ